MRLSGASSWRRPRAAELVQSVVSPCLEGSSTEAVGHEVHRPENDPPCAAEPAIHKAPGACRRVEPEPHVDRWHSNREERVDCVGDRRAKWSANCARRRQHTALPRLDEVARSVFGTQRVPDRVDASAPGTEVVAQSLRRAIGEAVRDDAERRCFHRLRWSRRSRTLTCMLPLLTSLRRRSRDSHHHQNR
jgi:hypothetical protein